MRTQEEILNQAKRAYKENDPMMSRYEVLASQLDYEHIVILHPDMAKDEWGDDFENIKKEMIDYMPSALEKAHDKRGLSAKRSMAYYSAWLWLEGQDDLAEMCCEYTDYGIDHLHKICDYLGLDRETGLDLKLRKE